MPPPPDPAAAAWNDGGNNGLDTILGRAFGIAGGYQEFNGVLEAVDINLYNDYGGDQLPMRVIVARLRAGVEAAGRQQAVLEAIYRALPGNFELRAWIETHVPVILPLVPQAEFESARLAYDAGRLQRRVGGIKRDLDMLAPGMSLTPQVRQLARDMIDRLDELNGYKSVHDALHQLQMSVMSEFARLSAETTSDAERQMSVALQLEEMKLARERIARQFPGTGARPAAVQSRDLVAEQIGRIVDRIAALDPAKRETAETAAGLLRAMLRPQMSLFDSRLVETSDQIPFEKFAQALAALEQPAVAAPEEGENPALLGNVSSSLEDIGERLFNRQKAHRLWQQAEATILNMEELLRGSGREDEIRFHWENLEILINQIAAVSADAEVARLLEIPNLRLALAGTADEVRSDPFRTAFNGFVRFARVRFQRADNALLEDCGQVRALHQPLQSLL